MEVNRANPQLTSYETHIQAFVGQSRESNHETAVAFQQWRVMRSGHRLLVAVSEFVITAKERAGMPAPWGTTLQGQTFFLAGEMLA